jgi:hypothetical protein
MCFRTRSNSEGEVLRKRYKMVSDSQQSHRSVPVKKSVLKQQPSEPPPCARHNCPLRGGNEVPKKRPCVSRFENGHQCDQ